MGKNHLQAAMKAPFLFLFFARMLVAATPTYVEDQSQVPILNPELKEWKIAKLRLDTGLEMILISDPKADLSAAAVAVKAGSWDDPDEYPGMAHFCEHMLFMGTEKYPDVAEFSNLIADGRGERNAYTASDRTVYTFSSQEGLFLPLLDRFAHFFIDPLFTPSQISRELHAVDQEHAKNLEHDGRRRYMVFKELSNPHHPNHKFSAGNAKSLANIPSQALKEWHKAHYGAGAMRVALYSSLPMEALQEAALASFGKIAPSSAPFKHSAHEITSADQRGKIVLIRPLKQKHELTLGWELPSSFGDDLAHTSELLSYAINRGQRYSLFEKLKREGWVEGFFLDADNLGGKEHPFLEATFKLSPEGVGHIDRVIEAFFSALAGIEGSGLPSYLWEEKNRVAKLFYQYQHRPEAFGFATKIGDALLDEPLETFPRLSLFSDLPKPEKVKALLGALTPSTALITLMTSSDLLKAPLKANYDRRERWFGVEYQIDSIPPSWKERWETPEIATDLRLPEPNPFLPTQLKGAPDPSLGSFPISFAKSDFGEAYYIRSPEFETPKSSLFIHLFSPLLEPTVQSSLHSSLYLDLLKEKAHSMILAAESAGLFVSFYFKRGELTLEIGGFSDKVPLLLQEVLQSMTSLTPTPESFEKARGRLRKSLLNAQKEPPLVQVRELLSSLLNQYSFPPEERLKALSTLSFEEFQAFCKKLFDKTFIQGFFAGNLTLKEAEASWLDVTHLLSRSPYLQKERKGPQGVALSSKGGPFFTTKSSEVQGHSTFLLIDEGPFTFETRGAQGILATALKEPFYHELRSRQKTGYLVYSDGVEREGELFQFFQVQSGSHEPEDLLFRFELFLEEFDQTLAEEISEERFETLKQGEIQSLKTRHRNLYEKAAFWDHLAFYWKGDFRFLEKRLDALEKLTYSRFLELARGFLSRENRKRLALLFEGRLPAPFAYAPIPWERAGEVTEKRL